MGRLQQLRKAAYRGRVSICKILLAEDPGLLDEPGGPSALCMACRGGRTAIAGLLLTHGVSPSGTSVDGMKNTPLHEAAAHGRAAVIDLLLELPSAPALLKAVSINSVEVVMVVVVVCCSSSSSPL